jgi:hypothetical protein
VSGGGESRILGENRPGPEGRGEGPGRHFRYHDLEATLRHLCRLTRTWIISVWPEPGHEKETGSTGWTACDRVTGSTGRTMDRATVGR